MTAGSAKLRSDQRKPTDEKAPEVEEVMAHWREVNQHTHISTERVLCASDSAYSGDAARFPATLSLAETSSLTIRSNTYAAR